LLLLSTLSVWTAGAIAWRLPATAGLIARAAPRDYLLLLRQPAYRRVLLFTFLSYFSLHGPMIMFPIYVREHGGDVALLGHMWIGMLLVEIPLMLYSGAIFARLGPRLMLSLATAAGALRWAICGVSSNMALVFSVQLLHAAVVTGVLVGGALYVESLVPRRLRSTAQSGLTMFGNGVGGILAGALSGVVLDRLGIDALFLASGLMGLTTAVLGIWLLPAHSRLPSAYDVPYAGADDEAA
jgi:MFS family permease